jgi:hypothetical protein
MLLRAEPAKAPSVAKILFDTAPEAEPCCQFWLQL